MDIKQEVIEAMKDFNENEMTQLINSVKLLNID